MKSFKQKAKLFVKIVSFVLIFLFLFQGVQKVFTADMSDREYRQMTMIYGEEENSLDAVYIGSSNTYAFWTSMVGFQEYGLRIMQYGCPAMPVNVSEYLIREARKTQPDALYLVTINTLAEEEIKDNVMHWLLDYMPFSKEKMVLTNHMTQLADLSLSDSLEYYVPMIRYHSRWDSLVPGNFADLSENYKNSNSPHFWYHNIKDVSKNYKTTDEKMELPDGLKQSIESLLDYCDEEKVKVLFVIAPQARKNVDSIRQYNTITEMVTSRGYEVLDLLPKAEEMGIDASKDFYNELHTNVHGSLKFTHYLSQYLIENYGFEDKREDAQSASWREAWEEYKVDLAQAALDFEITNEKRDYDMPAVQSFVGTKAEDRNILTWNTVEKADGYAVYRKSGKEKPWKVIGETTDGLFEDTEIDGETDYIYTVVPFAEKAGEKIYGDFKYNGIKCS